MPADDAVDRHLVGLVELGRAEHHPTVVQRGRARGPAPVRIRTTPASRRARSCWDRSGGRTGFEPVDPAPHVRLEVDVGLEGQPAELDDRAQLVAEDPEHLLGRLDRAAPFGQRLVEVGLDHLVDLGLVVAARGVVAAGAGEDLAGGIEAARTAPRASRRRSRSRPRPRPSAGGRVPWRIPRRPPSGMRHGCSSGPASRRTGAAAVRCGSRPAGGWANRRGGSARRTPRACTPPAGSRRRGRRRGRTWRSRARPSVSTGR